jgi:serine/threonine protein kinase
MTLTNPNQSSALALIGNYSVQQELGRNREGGRITYLANHTLTQQAVVLKQFRFVNDATWSGYKSYEREIEILQAIAHPQVPAYLDSFETEDGFCMVQEYKNAPSLAQHASLTPSQIRQIAVSVLEILVDLQQQVPPIIHRDIKPENILIDDTLQAYLIDFGLAKLNHETVAVSSVAAGTPGFMPPEELFNRPLNASADLYSVGATLICLLADLSSVQISELLDENYRFKFRDSLPKVNPRFADWLQTMVEPNPRDRFQTAAVALAALQAIDITDLTPLKPTSAQIPTSQKLPSRMRAAVILGITVGLPLIIGRLAYRPVETQSTALASAAIESEQQWFETIKPHCNSLEVVTAVQSTPYPKTPLGVGYGASCYALAGKLTLADQAIGSLSAEERITAAQVLFEIGHPVADQGDNESAGPIMDLVLKYWPENYMALYHAGMSAYVLAQNEKALKHLEAFLQIYQNNDGWTQSAAQAIDNIHKGIPAAQGFKILP